MNAVLSYDPGVIPTRPAPMVGERIEIHVAGLPPVKDRRQSIRNQSHPLHGRFVALRAAALEVMAGRAWVSGPVELELAIRWPVPDERHNLTDFIGGVMDTLDGSSGLTFTYLPIVFEDDSQVCSSRSDWEIATQYSYSVAVVVR